MAAPKTRSNTPKKDIKDAALALLIKGGISSVSMRDIAQAIGVSAMMPYRHYPSKDHLLMELRFDAFQQLAATMRSAASATNSPTDCLYNSCIAYVDFAIQSPNQYKLMFDQWKFDDPEALARDFGEHLEREYSTWRFNLEVVSSFIEHESLDIDKNVAAHLVWSQLHGLVQLYLMRKLAFGFKIEDLKHPCASAVLAMLRSTGKAIGD